MSDKKPREFWEYGYLESRPDLSAKLRRSIQEKVKVSDSGCWEWQRSRNASGYGEMYTGGVKAMAHRASYRVLVGPIPPNLFVLHKCDNPCCVNPEHLFLGSKRDNRLDQIAKGRDPAKAATHCKRGHIFDEENTLIQSSGKRQCRKCKTATKNLWQRLGRQMQKEDAVLSVLPEAEPEFPEKEFQDFIESAAARDSEGDYRLKTIAKWAWKRRGKAGK